MSGVTADDLGRAGGREAVAAGFDARLKPLALDRLLSTLVQLKAR